MSSPSTILKMADVIRRVVFLLLVGSTATVSSSQNVWDFPPFSTALPKKATSCLRRLGCRPFLWRLSCSTDATLSHIANVFQSWSTVAGYEEFIIITVYVTKEAFKDSSIFNEAIVIFSSRLSTLLIFLFNEQAISEFPKLSLSKQG